jgi:hypothetical protein
MAMFWVIGNGEDCFMIIMPKRFEKFVIGQSDDEKMSYLIERADHLPKMNLILLLLDFLLTHHLHLESGTNISLPRLNLFNFMDLLAG